MSDHGAEGRCRYPQSHATARDIRTEIAGVASNRSSCTSCYLDSVESMGEHPPSSGGSHHQGVARTHRLSDGSIYFFLSHSEVGGRIAGVEFPVRRQGNITVYRYGGPTEGEHILETDPLTVAPMEQMVSLDETHPADICFLPDVNGLDAGYLFVTEEFDRHCVSVYSWEPSGGLNLLGQVRQGFPGTGPNLLFFDRVGHDYYLGIATYHWGWGSAATPGPRWSTLDSLRRRRPVHQSRRLGGRPAETEHHRGPQRDEVDVHVGHGAKNLDDDADDDAEPGPCPAAPRRTTGARTRSRPRLSARKPTTGATACTMPCQLIVSGMPSGVPGGKPSPGSATKTPPR